MSYHLILTLDYEIFGDGSGCLKHCLVDPMERCLNVADSHSAKISSFVDALEFQSIKDQFNSEDNCSSFRQYELVEPQIQRMCSGAHNIQLHLHPQWLDAQVIDKSWILDFSKWRIGDLSFNEIDRCIERGLAYLEPLTKGGRSQFTTFRAGGWAIQPSTLVADALLNAGIYIDSTVAPGCFNLGKGDWYNFRSAPKLPFWHFDQDVCCPASGGRFLEVPITTQNIGRVSHFKAIKESRGRTAFPKGCQGTYNNPNSWWQNKIHKVCKIASMGRAMLDFSTMPAWALIDITKRHMSQFSDDAQAIPLVAIGHNKNFTNWSAEQFDLYLSWASAQDGIVFSDYNKWFEEVSLTK